MMALPHTYGHTSAKENSAVQVTVTGGAGGDWFIIKKEKWELHKENKLPVAVHVSINENIAWKLFTKSWRKKEVIHHVAIAGDPLLAEPVMDMISVMA